ncbi:MAG: GNAT family N-acetyltransferase [Lachnospiraceae bacterium]|nr:GNAT family N-acetyltransferase [Lachnospiraceae bacterium]
MIRTAKEEDAEKLLKIYAYYVEKTAVSFEYTVPAVEEFRERIKNVLKKYPYLVSEMEGEIVGYAYAGPFKERAAYDRAVETTIYLRKDKKRQGLGKELYRALENALALQHILNLNACIACPAAEEDEYITKDSQIYHAHLGYRLVGEFQKCGYKFNRWYNMVWMEKQIGAHPENPLPIRRFDEIREELWERFGIS